MPDVTVQRDIAAPQSAVWAVLADFPNISDWNGGVTASHATSDAVEGVGAQRHCDLAPMGELEETVLEWEPPRRMVVSIDAAKKIPVKTGRVTFTIDEGSDHSPTTLSYDFTAKGGVLAPLIGRVLTGQLRKGFSGFLEDLERAAQGRTAAS